MHDELLWLPQMPPHRFHQRTRFACRVAEEAAVTARDDAEPIVVGIDGSTACVSMLAVPSWSFADVQ